MSRPPPAGSPSGADRLPALGVPMEIFDIGSLRALTLSGCSLEVNISLARFVCVFSVSQRVTTPQAKDLPDAISKLTNLTELWLQDNRFDELPPPVCKLPKLRYMLLDQNTETIQTLSALYEFKGRDDKQLGEQDKALRAIQNARSKKASKKAALDKMAKRTGAL